MLIDLLPLKSLLAYGLQSLFLSATLNQEFLLVIRVFPLSIPLSYL